MKTTCDFRRIAKSPVPLSAGIKENWAHHPMKDKNVYILLPETTLLQRRTDLVWGSLQSWEERTGSLRKGLGLSFPQSSQSSVFAISLSHLSVSLKYSLALQNTVASQGILDSL